MNTSLPQTPRLDSKPAHHGESKKSAPRHTKSFSRAMDEAEKKISGKSEKKKQQEIANETAPLAYALPPMSLENFENQMVQEKNLLDEEMEITNLESADDNLAHEVAMNLQNYQSNIFASQNAKEKIGLVGNIVDFTHYLVELITACDLVDKAEYSFHLDSERFLDTPFEGMKIVVHEYQHAPKMYNIQILASVAACEMITKHMSEILGSFANQTKFKVHRLEIELLDEDKPQKRKYSKKVKALQEKEELSR